MGWCFLKLGLSQMASQLSDKAFGAAYLMYLGSGPNKGIPKAIEL
jgi:hypothetical protein